MATLTRRTPVVKAGRPADSDGLKARLRARGITYPEIARMHEPPWSWHHVWMVVNGHRTSGPVMKVIRKLLGPNGAAA